MANTRNRKTTKTTKPKPKTARTTYGYQAIAVVARGDVGEMCERLTLRRANENDVRAGAGLLLAMARDGVRLGWTTLDRAFNNDVTHFLDPCRQAGISLAFILKKTDCGFDGYLKTGHLLIIDGWLYPDTLPKTLWDIPVPDVAATEVEKNTYYARIDRRNQWAFVRLQIIDAACVKLGSPARYGKLLCPDLHDLDSYDGPPPEICPGGHKDGEGCLMKTVYWDASCAPRTWQILPIGSRQHRSVYWERGSVERFFARLKTTSGVHFERGRFRVRGLRRVGAILGLAAVAANLQQQASTAQRAKRRRYRQASQNPASRPAEAIGRYPTPAPLKPVSPRRTRSGSAVDRSRKRAKRSSASNTRATGRK